ncbi:Arm DNA-binding domain-containing protein [Mucilaginibacter sp. cycad4]|uniref:Arm DNA-binding domain-containing protein n=1 Tax=Mucilaginibacter sp. cycad4 TaxID=3342096 RepID=UPI002AABC645|nr:Arm DNA-binding domain-containing protein [Mucilaginibacter gossypii]WPV02960.1 Arm DNA-binding domain-containing protein [Mucilaginibacter gossypii]
MRIKSAVNKSFTALFVFIEGLAPVYLRITINGVRIEISSKHYVNPDKWSTNGQKLTGNNKDTKSINAYLKTLEHQVYDVHRDMIERRLLITAPNLKTGSLVAKPRREKCWCRYSRNITVRLQRLLAKEYAKGTLDRYETSLKHTQAFLQ